MKQPCIYELMSRFLLLILLIIIIAHIEFDMGNRQCHNSRSHAESRQPDLEVTVINYNEAKAV